MSNATDLPIHVGRRRRLANSCIEEDCGAVLRTGDGDRISVGSRADIAAARRLGRAFRRVDRVEIAISGSGAADATLYAVGHRIPMRRRISVGAALGLARLGVPTVVETTGERER